MSELQIIRVPVDTIVPNAYNPNEMDAETFNALASDIGEQDLDQPILVRKRQDGMYEIIDGEHRWRAAKVGGLSHVHVSIREMTDTEAKLTTVRRNVLRGSMDRTKFTSLVKGLVNASNSVEAVRQKMGMRDREFARVFTGLTDEKVAVATSLSTSEKNLSLSTAVANLSQTIRDIVQLNGDTLPQGFIVFAYRGKVNVMVSMDSKLQKVAQEFFEGCRVDGKSQAEISGMLADAFKDMS